MAKTKVHELAQEFGVESKWVLEQLREMGEFVKSASSTVSLPAEMRFRKEHGGKLKADHAAAALERPPRPFANNNPFAPAPPPTSKRQRLRARRAQEPTMPKLLTRAEWEALKPKRWTSWDTAGVDPEGQAVWRRYGLGDDDAPLAFYLAEHGILPEDLHLMLRGRRAVARLRGGEEARSVLVKEMLESRSKVEPAPQELPSTKVVRRRNTG